MARSWWARMLAFASGVEFWSGAGLIGWGAWVLADPDNLNGLPSYDPISDYVPGTAIAVTYGIIGAAQAGLHATGWTWCRTGAAFLAMLLYKVLCVSIINSPTPGPGAMVFCAWALANAAVFLRLAR